MRAAPPHLLLLAGVCAMLQDDQYLAMEFSTKMKHNENCELCYGTDCLSMDETRCQYYRKTENILQNRTEKSDSNYTGIIIDKIDDYLIEYVQEGSQIYNNYDCIPLISQYTNCYRENICTGCQTCNCDSKGHWNCTMVKRCDSTEDFTRGRPHTLATVMENLKGYMNMFQENNIKRSINYDNDTEQEQIKYDDIVKFLDGIDHFENNNKINTTEKLIVNQSNTSKRVGNIESILYMKSLNLPTFDYLNTINDNETQSLRKREIELNESQQNSSTTSDNSSTNIMDFKDNVLYPLFIIINEKQKELEQLIKVEEKLVIYFKSFSNINTSKITNNSEINDDPYLYFYKLEIPFESKDDTRRSNYQPKTRDIKEKYLKKLKRHLFEVRDIVNIQRLYNFSDIPHELKVLIQAIKYYINKEKRDNKGIGKKPTTFHFRRQYDSNSKLIHPLHIVSNVFESVDTNVPVANILKPFSPKAKQILERIINQFNNNDFYSSKIFDRKYDIGKVLIDMGHGWNKISASIIKSPLTHRLYCIKFLHLEVSANIDKIKLALEYLQKAENPNIKVNEYEGGDISKIESDFNHINQRIEGIIQLQVLKRNLNKNKSATFRNKSQSTINLIKNSKTKTKTFLQTVKKLLKNTKKEIRDLFRKKLSKSDIMIESVDKTTKNKPTDYEKTIQRWQNNLNVRNKRSTSETESFFSRLKNIIPHYLRGKVNPVHKRRDNKTNSVGKKHSHRGRKRTKKISIKSTTPVI